MPREFSRRHRVAEELQRELGLLITREVKDPRVQLVSISDVEVSADLKYAKVYVASFDVTAEDDRATRAVVGLRAAEGFLKRQLAQRLRLRVMPELRFIADHTERDAQEMDRLIESAVETDRLNAEAVSDEPADEAERAGNADPKDRGAS